MQTTAIEGFRKPSQPPNAAAPTADMPMGISGYVFADLFAPAKLRALHDLFFDEVKAGAPDAFATFDHYRRCKGVGMKPEDVSTAILALAPHVSAFVARLFKVERVTKELHGEVEKRSALFSFRRDFVKKRVLKDAAGDAFVAKLEGGVVTAENIARTAMKVAIADDLERKKDEELSVARTVMHFYEVDDVARKARKAGGAHWTDDLRARAAALRAALSPMAAAKDACAVAGTTATDDENEKVVAFALDAFEAWLAARKKNPQDKFLTWPSLHRAKNLDYQHLVEYERPDSKMPEMFVGPEHDRRERDGFALTDRRMNPREVEQELDYCLLCHDRDKDSCTKGLREAKTPSAGLPAGEPRPVKKNPLGVLLEGCPLGERISEMHAIRQQGDALGALAIVCVDNPMCPGTGHRICNDCMKACVFQKQEPVNIPQVETRVLTEVLSMPFGVEIYGFLTRWNPLNVERPYNLPYNGKNVLVVGLGPAGYTLSHHLTREGFCVAAIDGLKIEPLPEELVGTHGKAPPPIADFGSLYRELDERLLLGFGGVSEYGITVRWDKNFLTVLYITLSRNPLLNIYGGIRFGGTMTLEDAWELGFDHVAIAAGAGRPTIIDMKGNLSRGIRKASDFLMALQLTGAYKKSSIANLQIELPAVVIGGGLTAIDTATELYAYYPVQIEKTYDRIRVLTEERGEAAVRAMFDDEEWALLQKQLEHAKELEAERDLAAHEGRDPKLQHLVDKWGGVTLVYRKSLLDSPAYRLNHEEVAKSLEEGVRYVENMSPEEAILDHTHHVKAVRFKRADGTTMEIPARTLCVAAGTSPNVTYEKEQPGTFQLDAKKQYFAPHAATVDANGKIALAPSKPREGFFTSYLKDNRAVSFYGDNHPHYAGSVVKAMASAKDGFPFVAKLFPEVASLDASTQPARDAKLATFVHTLDDLLCAEVVAVNRLTETIVEVVVKAKLAARKFKPGQFYRLQNFEAKAPVVAGTRLAMEGLALTGAWIDEEKGLLGTIVLEMGGSSRLCAALEPGEPVILMGPTGTPTEIAANETVLLCGGGLGNAVLFSIARAMKALGAKVLYFAGYKRGEDLFKQDEIEAHTDQVIWTTDTGKEIAPRRPQDAHFRGNIVQAMIAYAKGEVGAVVQADGAKRPRVSFGDVSRIIAIGSDRMMAAVKDARHGVLEPYLDPKHHAIGSINSPMQCMMKEICAQCLQKHRDPATGKETVVFSCFNQDQDLDRVDFVHLRERLRANSMQEKVSNAWLERLLKMKPSLIRV
jgi:NADPH-dependent glutamate synthase beta subunit-like oxidoreductase/NAD(P)H-flavin reductase